MDLRSDTLTKPTDAMRQAMAAAPVGDDVFGEDPTVNRLEERVAAMLGKEAALFVPSGTMGNQIGVRLHCAGGDEMLCEADCHIYQYEQAAYAQLWGVACQPIPAPGGMLTPELFDGRVRGDDIHFPRTRLLCLENTHNRLGGAVLPHEGVEAVCEWAASQGLARHLDGARLWNAAIASGRSLAELAAPFDTLSVCFSKGLGAPAGSAVVGTREHIARARRHRKAMGGGMRQAGILAAGALFALENHLERMADDHANARLLAEAANDAPHLSLFATRCETNIVMLQVDPAAGTAADIAGRLHDAGVQVLALGKQKLRLVTHLGVSREECERVAELLHTV